ncbi:MAG: hypothetical protein D3917_19195, partial [Candidatus Electrothrix sp. AX5]|nr:hypothetical protein [Candidatus Electrothrix sp. AX5]
MRLQLLQGIKGAAPVNTSPNQVEQHSLSDDIKLEVRRDRKPDQSGKRRTEKATKPRHSPTSPHNASNIIALTLNIKPDDIRSDADLTDIVDRKDRMAATDIDE